MTKWMVASVAEKKPDKGSWSIMLYTGYTASHLILVRLPSDKVYHANGKLVCTDTTLSELLKTCAIIDAVTFNAPVTDQEFDEWWAKLDGLPYSDWQFGGFFFKWNKWLKSFFKNERRGAICTEFVAWFMEDMMGRKEFADLEFEKPWPVFDMVKRAVS